MVGSAMPNMAAAVAERFWGRPISTSGLAFPVAILVGLVGAAVGAMLSRAMEMNDSRYGLTASIWTSDVHAALRIGDRVETGTWFLNRCDYLDPALAWTGVKDSGRGCSLSDLGYEALTRPKSFHLRLKP